MPQKAVLLGSIQLLVTSLALDPVADGRGFALGGLGLLGGDADDGFGRVGTPLRHEVGAQLKL
jgi:hypothetical protein